MSMPNIALCGKLRAGKDEIARYLSEKYGYTPFAFGDELKAVCHRLYPEEFADGRKPRALLQGFGQMARTFGDGNVWVNACFRKIKTRRIVEKYATFPVRPFRAVITDLRQPNEYERCRTEGYTIIRVNASEELRFQRAQAAGDTFEAGALAHDTEQHVDLFAVDYDVYNVGTLAELHAQIDAIMEAVEC